MNRDITIEKLPKGETPYVNNANATEDYGVITNEKGNELNSSLPNGYYLIGHCVLDNDKIVLFATNNTNSALYLKDGSNISTIVPPTLLLNFSIEHQIECVFKRNSKDEYIVYWTDNYNPPRYINITNPISITSDTINSLDIFKSYKRPDFVLNNVNLGGTLKSGVIQYFIQYENIDGSITDIIGASNPVSITNSTPSQQVTKYDGCEPNITTGKSVNMTVYNIDTTYKYINIIAAYWNNGVLESPTIIKKLPITNNLFISFTHTGSENLGTLSTNELFSLFANYKTAKTIEVFDNVLYMGNLTEAVNLPLQKYVNNCYVTYNTNTVRLNTTKGFSNETVIYSDRGYMQDDVYALYIAYVLKDGRYTKAYHIPGRGASIISKYVRTTTFYENDLISVIKAGTTYDSTLSSPETRSIPDNVLDEALNINPNARWFQFFGTNNNSANISNLSYWENESEVYDDNENWDVYSLDVNGLPVANGTLRNAKVRHHRMPEPEIKNASGTTFLNSLQKDRGNIIGIRVHNIPFPAEYKDQLAGYKIFWAKKNTDNSLVLAQDALTFDRTFIKATSIITDVYNTNPGINMVTVPGTWDNKSFCLRDFNAIKNNFDISTVSYVKNIGIIRGASDVLFSYFPSGGDPTRYQVYRYTDFTDVLEPITGSPSIWYQSTDSVKKARDTEYIRQIKTINYIEPDNVNAGQDGCYGNGSIFNYSNNFYTYHAEKNIKVEVVNGFDISSTIVDLTASVTSATNYEDRHLVNLMSYKNDLFNSFDTQELVDTGVLFYTIPVGYTTTSTAIYGGDTFYNYTTYRAQVDLNNAQDIDFTNKMEYRNLSIVPHLSRANIKFRNQGKEVYEIYYPKSKMMDVLNVEPDKDNYYGYNNDYSKVNDILQLPIQSNLVTLDNNVFKSRIIRSNVDNIDGIYDGLLQFPVNSYKDLDKNRGQIEVIKRDNIGLIINLTNAITKTMARDVLKTDLTTAYLGNGDIFSTPTKEIIYSELGVGGTVSQWANIVTPFGYIYPDFKNRKVVLYNQQYSEISSNGMILFFQQHMPFKLLQQFPDITFKNIDNPANTNGLGFTAVWDNEYKRYILTKRDYEMVSSMYDKYEGSVTSYPSSPILYTNVYYEPEKVFKYWTGSEWATANFNNPQFFNQVGFSVSYYPELKSWFSFYDYKPLYYIGTRTDFYSLIDNNLWKHNSNTVNRCLYYNGNQSEFIVDIPFNDQGSKSKLFNSVQYVSKYELNNVEYVDKTFSKYVIYSSQGISLTTDIINRDTARVVNSTWYINDFRDCRLSYSDPVVDDLILRTDNVDVNANKFNKRRFIDNWIVLRLIDSDTVNKKLGLIFNSSKAVVVER